MPRQSYSFLSALPAYFGGKRQLLGWIFCHLNKAVPQADWQKMTLIDLFVGGGAVTQYAKTQGFQSITAVDCSKRSQIIGKALLQNPKRQLLPTHLLYLNQSLPESSYVGLAESTYCPSVFSRRHAQALDRWFYWAHQIKDETLRSLMLLAIWRCIYRFICIPTSVNVSNRPFAEALDGLRSWDTLNPKRFQDGSLESLLKPCFEWLSKEFKAINQGVFEGSPVKLYQADALSMLPQLEGDIMYADPPYSGTASYEKTFEVIDALLGAPPMTAPSIFSQSVNSLNPLLDQAQHIETWVLSYGNKILDLNELVSLVQRHAGNRQVQGFAKAYPHLAHVAKKQDNQELLIVASPKLKVISYAN